MHKKAPAIRALLRENAVGMTSREIATAMGMTRESVRVSLSFMPDVYVDHWRPTHNAWEAVYCAVEVPEDAPRPSDRPSEWRAKMRRVVLESGHAKEPRNPSSAEPGDVGSGQPAGRSGLAPAVGSVPAVRAAVFSGAGRPGWHG